MNNRRPASSPVCRLDHRLAAGAPIATSQWDPGWFCRAGARSTACWDSNTLVRRATHSTVSCRIRHRNCNNGAHNPRSPWNWPIPIGRVMTKSRPMQMKTGCQLLPICRRWNCHRRSNEIDRVIFHWYINRNTHTNAPSKTKRMNKLVLGQSSRLCLVLIGFEWHLGSIICVSRGQ